VIAEVIPILSLLVIFLLLSALSASILPTSELLLLIAVVAAAVVALLWRWFIRVHTRMQIALLETLENSRDHRTEETLSARDFIVVRGDGAVAMSPGAESLAILVFNGLSHYFMRVFLIQLSSQTSRAQCHTDSQLSSVTISSSASHSTTVPSSSTQ
jgi:hypothetical protein